MNSKVALSDVKLLRQLYISEQLSAQAIANRLGVSGAGVNSALRRAGIPRRSRSSAGTLRFGDPPEIDQMVSDYQSGMTLAEVGKKHGRCSATVIKYLRLRSVTMRPTGFSTKYNHRHRIKIRVEEAIRLNQEGRTLVEICEILPEHPTPAALHRNLKRVGYKVIKYTGPNWKGRNKHPDKRELAALVGVEKCLVCPETRGVQLCHVQARRMGGPMCAENLIALCNNHHWFFDRGQLTDAELQLLKPSLLIAQKHGYTHHRYLP